MWIKHHSWRQLFCTHLLTLKICVATIAICFLGHPVEMPPVLDAALASFCSTRCTVPGKHQLQSPQRLGGGGHWTAQALKRERGPHSSIEFLALWFLNRSAAIFAGRSK